MASDKRVEVTRAWSAMVRGPEAENALGAVHDIADSLVARAEDVDDPTLGGRAALALFFGYFERAGFSTSRGPMAVRMLNRAEAGVAETHLGPGVFSGFTGVAWTSALLRGHGAAGVERALLGHVTRFPSNGRFDLVGGLVGFGAYALERLPNPRAMELVAAVMDRLVERAERVDGGITWLTRFPRGHPHAARFPNGTYDLGLAHGVPGVIAFLAAAHELGVGGQRAEDLLRGAVAWTLAQELPATSASRFPAMFGPGEPGGSARTAWCYGDPGVAAALLAAADALEDGELRRKALSWAVDAAGRSVEASGVVDAGLCHGSAGLAHVFACLHARTGHLALRDAATAWARWTLEHRRPGRGIAGFLSWESAPPRRELAWRPAPGFLTGAVGIGLALLAAATDLEPAWDRLLLLSARPREAC